MSIIKTPEDEFIQELEGYLNTKFDKYSVSRIHGYLGDYRNNIPDKAPIVIKQERVIYRELKSKDIIVPNPEYKVISPMGIINKVLDATGLTMKQLTGKERYLSLIVARHVSMYMIRDICGLTTSNIGKIFNRDHTTVMHAISHVLNMVHVGNQQYIKLIGYINFHLLTEEEEKKSA